MVKGCLGGRRKREVAISPRLSIISFEAQARPGAARASSLSTHNNVSLLRPRSMFLLGRYTALLLRIQLLVPKFEIRNIESVEAIDGMNALFELSIAGCGNGQGSRHRVWQRSKVPAHISVSCSKKKTTYRETTFVNIHCIRRFNLLLL